MRLLRILPLLLVAACAAPMQQQPATVQPATEQTPVEPVPAVTAPAHKPSPPPAAPKPERLSGLNPKQVQALVGEPSLVRRDGTVQIMLFETANCVLEIVFYEANPDAHFIANHLNARNRSGADTDLQACLVNLLPNGQWLDASSTAG